MSFLNDHAVGEVRLSVALIDPKAATSSSTYCLFWPPFWGTFVSTTKWRPDAEGVLCGSFSFF